MTERLRAVFLPVPRSVRQDLLPLAEAFVSSPAWAAMHRAVVVVGDGPAPRWGVLGWLDDGQAALVEAAAWQVPQTLDRLRYVDYAAAEADAAVLAQRLVEHLGDEVRSSTFRPVPRGGSIVHGMLAYALRLPADPSAGDGDRPVVLVDDCALSGSRIRRALAENPGVRLIFATLYSPPQLRAAVLAAEPRVVGFVSARDLDDHAPRELGDGYAAWVDRWAGRVDDYWIGNPDHVAFAWSEPDVTIWNEVTMRAEVGWRVVPPSKCLKNRAAGTPRLQVQSAAQPAPIEVAPDVLSAELETRTVVASSAHGSVLGLSGVAREAWKAILLGADDQRITQAITDRYDVDPGRARADVEALVAELGEKGLVRRR